MAAVMEITPGPNMGYLAVTSLMRGRRAGMAAVVGTALGLLFVGIASALGMATVIAQSALLYQSLRWGGVLFLLWLAWDGWRTSSIDIAAAPEFMGDRRYAARGFVTNILNPKAFLFYVSVLPNFINTNANVMTGAMVLTIIYVVIATGVHTAIVTLASSMQRFMDNPALVQKITRGLSILLAVIALWLLWKTRL